MKRDWIESELVLALDLYLNEPNCKKGSDKLIALSIRIGRSIGSVYARLQNFKAVDPSYKGTGLSAGIRVCDPIWNKYSARLKVGDSVIDILQELEFNQDNTLWQDAVLTRLETRWGIGKTFSLQEVYEYESELSVLFPENQHVRDKIRQIMQRLRDNGFIRFENKLGHYSRIVDSIDSLYPDTMNSEEIHSEGAMKLVTVNAYERSRSARDACITHFGDNCRVCRMSFRDRYGDIGEGFIHVHHLKSIASIGEQYVVDPVNDLIPICPNCHAMLHRRNPPLTVGELSLMLRSAFVE